MINEEVGMEDIEAAVARFIAADRDCEAGRLECAEICVDSCADDWGILSVRGRIWLGGEIRTSFDADGGEA